MDQTAPLPSTDGWQGLAAPIVPGTRIGRYVVLRQLGRGSMGTVYQARDSVLGRHVALKALNIEDACSRQRFAQEARAMARVSHPNVVQVFDVLRMPRADGGESCLIAMELVDGCTLEQWLRSPRSWQEIRDVLAAAARGLAAAHRAGLVHRDFKPANVLVGRDGRARVTDFGLSLSDEERASTIDEQGGTEMDSTNLTGLGMVVGTPAYMAPEQHRGQVLSPASDQFALCVALYEALAGARPYQGRTCQELSQHKHQGAPRPGGEAKRAPAWLWRVVRRGLRVDPYERHESMDALVRALQGPTSRATAISRWLAAATLVVVGAAGLWQVTAEAHSDAAEASGLGSGPVLAALEAEASAAASSSTASRLR